MIRKGKQTDINSTFLKHSTERIFKWCVKREVIYKTYSLQNGLKSKKKHKEVTFSQQFIQSVSNEFSQSVMNLVSQ